LPTIAPHFHFHAESYIPVPTDVITPVYESWLNKLLTLSLRAVNVTHYAFGAGPADGSVPIQDIAYVGGDIISWGFTGVLVGAYATSNGGNGRRRRISRIGIIRVGARLGRIGMGRVSTENTVRTTPEVFGVEMRYHSDSI
jgi:hypothetical protein